jgi:hypothetical protein
MQIRLGLCTLLFAVLLNTGLPTVSFAACADYETEVKRAVTNLDFDTLEKLLPRLNSKQAACPLSYLESVKRSMAQIAAARADGLMQQSKLAQAEAWLKRAPTKIWNTSVIHGNINAQREQWAMAVQFFNQALDLIDDPESTPQAQHKLLSKIFINWFPSPNLWLRIRMLLLYGALYAGFLEGGSYPYSLVVTVQHLITEVGV